MNYHKPNNYIRSCILFGCLFSYNVVLDLNADKLVHAEDAVYLYQVTLNEDNPNEHTSPVDPLNPDSSVMPIPPTYTPREENEVEVKPKVDKVIKEEPRAPTDYSTLPPNGKKLVHLPPKRKNYKAVYSKKIPEVPDVSVTLSGGIQDQSLGGGGENQGHSYLGEMFSVLSGKVLFGHEDTLGKKMVFEND